MEDELPTLCQQCGFCCDGTLFTHVAMTPGEVRRLDGRVTLKPRKDGGVSLKQPCAALDGCRCSVYRDRPQGCAEYVCLLGRALSEEETSLAGATQILHEAQRRLRELEVMLPVDGNARGSVAFRARVLAATGALSPEALVAQRALEAFLRFHFLGAQRG